MSPRECDGPETGACRWSFEYEHLERENKELLEALKAICDPHFWTNTVGEETFLEFEASEHLIRNGRAAIAKAEGK
jgi:hypothetical protein